MKKRCSNCGRCELKVRADVSYYLCHKKDYGRRVDPDYACDAWRSRDERPIVGRRSMT